MKKLFLLSTILSLLSLQSLKAQATVEDSIKATINAFFEGMKNADTAAIRAAMTEGAIFQTFGRTKEGSLNVRTENISDFLAFVAKQGKDDADERVEFGSIKVDGILASVWTPYKFYLKGQFSHCGANSFQMVKLKGRWQIQYLIDTRRKKGCE
jgi:hypothetical protein